jgi:hypothetical protein
MNENISLIFVRVTVTLYIKPATRTNHLREAMILARHTLIVEED